ncbi:uncharacterized protein METZ01_LOCUS276080 [marine metagenome]|uniref:Uncharacterized protein n=1 Tax=marine metagenome TaxID=408172 RepID=A0A382KGM8_9ZZZZ
MSNQSADLTVRRLKIDLSSDPVEVCPWFDRVPVDLHDNHATGQPPVLLEGLTPVEAICRANGGWRVLPTPSSSERVELTMG